MFANLTMELGLCDGTTHQERVTMSHFGFENDGKSAVKTSVVFSYLFVIITFLTAAFGNQAIQKWVFHLVKMNAKSVRIERVAFLGLIMVATLGVTLSVFPLGILCIFVNVGYLLTANSCIKTTDRTPVLTREATWWQSGCIDKTNRNYPEEHKIIRMIHENANNSIKRRLFKIKGIDMERIIFDKTEFQEMDAAQANEQEFYESKWGAENGLEYKEELKQIVCPFPIYEDATQRKIDKIKERVTPMIGEPGVHARMLITRLYNEAKLDSLKEPAIKNLIWAKTTQTAQKTIIKHFPEYTTFTVDQQEKIPLRYLIHLCLNTPSRQQEAIMAWRKGVRQEEGEGVTNFTRRGIDTYLSAHQAKWNEMTPLQKEELESAIKIGLINEKLRGCLVSVRIESFANTQEIVKSVEANARSIFRDTNYKKERCRVLILDYYYN